MKSLKNKAQVHSIEELKDFVKKNLQILKQPKQIILLEGEMGSGKTEFVKQLVSLIGGDFATSPSFAIHNTYETPQLSIEHVDLYRLVSEDDLHSVGFWDLFENETSMVIVEWSNKIKFDRLPLTWKKQILKFKILSESEREISFEFLSS